MKREKIDFTDNELNFIARALQSYINVGDFYMTKSTNRILKSTMQKVIDNGMKRKQAKRILSPLVEFDN